MGGGGDPRPWLEEGAPSSELKVVLDSARLDDPSAAQLANVAAKLGPLLVAPAAATVPAVAGKTAAGAAVKSGLAVKVIASIGAAAVVGGAYQAGRVHQEKTVPPTVIEKRVEVPVPVPAPPVVVPQPEPVVEPEPAPVAPPLPPVVVKKPSAPSPQAEASLLESAMAALKSGAWARALALCERHAREAPDGVLVQEREVIAIEALVRLGRRGDAKARAEKFKAKFPTSTHLLKVEALIGE